MNEKLRPDLQSSLVCDDVRQEANGKFILIGLFDTLGARQIPFVHPQLCVVNRWCSGEGGFSSHTRILAPDQGTIVAEGKDIPVRLPSAEATATNIELFVNVPFRQTGTHWVEILLDGELALRYPLRVNEIRPASPA